MFWFKIFLTYLQLLSTLIDRLPVFVVEEAILAHKHNIVVELLSARVLTGVKLLLHGCKVHWVFDDIIVVGNVQSFGVDRLQKRPCKVFATVTTFQLFQNLLAVIHLLWELAVVTRLQQIVVDFGRTFRYCTTLLFNDGRWRRLGFTFSRLLKWR